MKEEVRFLQRLPTRRHGADHRQPGALYEVRLYLDDRQARRKVSMPAERETALKRFHRAWEHDTIALVREGDEYVGADIRSCALLYSVLTTRRFKVACYLDALRLVSAQGYCFQRMEE